MSAAQPTLPLSFAPRWAICVEGRPVGSPFPSYLAALRRLLDLSAPVDPAGPVDPRSITIRAISPNH